MLAARCLLRLLVDSLVEAFSDHLISVDVHEYPIFIMRHVWSICESIGMGPSDEGAPQCLYHSHFPIQRVLRATARHL